MGIAVRNKEAAWTNGWCCKAAAAVLVVAIFVATLIPMSGGTKLLSIALPGSFNVSAAPPIEPSSRNSASAPLPPPPGLIPATFSPFGNQSVRPAAVVAISVQCSSKYLSAWRSLFASLTPEERSTYAVFVYYHGHDAADQAGATAFLTDWAMEAGSVLALASTPATRATAPDTWSSGRNALASAVYAYEISRGRQFGWWGFADGDMSNLICRGHDASDPRHAATCFTLYTSATMGSPFALVATLGFGKYAGVEIPASEKAFLSPGEGYNVDGMFNIMHRRAIPVLLPYHEDLDRRSWWGSQVIMNWYFASCVYGASASSALHFHSISQTSESAYPRGMIPDNELEATLRKSHPAFVERFFEGRRKAGASIWPAMPFPPPRVIDLTVDKLPEWQTSDDFAFCAKVRAPEFAAKIARGFPEAPLA